MPTSFQLCLLQQSREVLTCPSLHHPWAAPLKKYDKAVLNLCICLRLWVTLCSFLSLGDAKRYFGCLLNLAHKDLRSLSLQDHRYALWSSRSLPKLASLTGLTRLELIAAGTGDVEEVFLLRDLQLQELVLINCPGLEWKLFVPGALSRLRKLHIEDGGCIAIGSGCRARNHLMFEEERDQLKAAGKVVFQLDELSQISGLCNLFVAGMRRGLRKWDDAALPGGTMVSNEAFHCCPLHLMKVWTKPRS